MKTQLEQLVKHNKTMGYFCQRWHNDCTDVRARLEPYVAKFLNNPSSKETEQIQALVIMDWYLRVNIPTWLDLINLKAESAALRAHPAITKWSDLAGIQPLLNVAKEKASGAAYAAASGAAYDAAYDAAYAAASGAAYDAAYGAASGAAYAAAYGAASGAAYGAASDAAKKKLSATVSFLQNSAFEMLDRCVMQDPLDILKEML